MPALERAASLDGKGVQERGAKPPSPAMNLSSALARAVQTDAIHLDTSKWFVYVVESGKDALTSYACTVSRAGGLERVCGGGRQSPFPLP